jgi:hypothetical protein
MMDEYVHDFESSGNPLLCSAKVLEIDGIDFVSYLPPRLKKQEERGSLIPP